MLTAAFDGKVIAANPAWSTILGWVPDEIVGTSFFDLLHPDDRDQTIAEAAALMIDGKQVPKFINRYRTHDGQYREIDWTAVSDGQFIHAIGRDITQERASAEALRVVEKAMRRSQKMATEEKLTLSQEQLRLATDIGEIGEWNVDHLTGAMFWPPRVKAMFGISPDVPVTLDDYYNGVHPDDREKTLAAYSAASDPELRALYEVDYRTVGREDGVIRWVAARGRGLFNADGVCFQVIGTAIDITARKADEVRLRELNEQLEQKVTERTAERNRVWEISRELLAIIGFDGRLKVVNPAWTNMLGYNSETLLSLPFPHHAHPDDHQAVEAMMKKLLHGETVERVEVRFWHADGSLRWVSWTFVPEGDAFYAVGRDVTTEKEAANELERAQEALRQSQKMEAVGQLTGGLAHDFNNLLTGMMGNLELLQDRIARGRLDDIDRFINAAQGAGRRAASLTQRLLAFSRRQTLDPKPTDVNRLIASMEDMLRRTVGRASHIEVVGAAGLWTANIDAGQLENALLNLCINARDAMPDGGRITIETANKWLDDRTAKERELAPGQYLSICVTDTGCGMSADMITRAFEPFYTTKPIGQGTGLGLSMIYGFARQSGGQVRIYSEVGVGTTVCVYLPRHVGGAEQVEAGEAIRAVAGATGQRVLVVDDEPTIRHLIEEVLNEAGYTVIGAADGIAGIKVLQSGARIELLITDVGLPNGMNGRQVADAARIIRPGLKVLFITGYAENAAVGNGHLEPGMELLTKPFSMDALAAKVGDMMTAAI